LRKWGGNLVNEEILNEAVEKDGLMGFRRTGCDMLASDGEKQGILLERHLATI
jgi:hypothetical protein